MLIKKSFNFLSRQVLPWTGVNTTVTNLLGPSYSFTDSTALSKYLRNPSARSYGTNPGQKAQHLAATQAAGKVRQKQVARLRGATKLPNGTLELDVKKNPFLAKTVNSLIGEGLPKDLIARHLDKTKSLTEFTLMADGPLGMLILINCESKHAPLARQTVTSFAKKSGMRMTVTEGNDKYHYFERKGFVTIPKVIDGKELDEEMATDLAIEVSAEDVVVTDQHLELICDPSDYKECLSSLEERGIEILSSEVTFRALEKIEIDETHMILYEAFCKILNTSAALHFNFISMVTNFES